MYFFFHSHLIWVIGLGYWVGLGLGWVIGLGVIGLDSPSA
jgi:hypothetical protein